jgi:hypothetical protein
MRDDGHAMPKHDDDNADPDHDYIDEHDDDMRSEQLHYRWMLDQMFGRRVDSEYELCQLRLPLQRLQLDRPILQRQLDSRLGMHLCRRPGSMHDDDHDYHHNDDYHHDNDDDNHNDDGRAMLRVLWNEVRLERLGCR